MIWEETWPNYKWTDEQACRKMVAHYHLNTLVSFGKTKIFIKTPRTVYYLEEQREKKMPELVYKLNTNLYCSCVCTKDFTCAVKSSLYIFSPSPCTPDSNSNSLVEGVHEPTAGQTNAGTPSCHDLIQV